MLRFRGSQCFRQRLVCATISGRPIRIDDIRTDDQNPGLRDYEASLLRLIEKITNGCIIEINETGTSLRYKPGFVAGGGQSQEHDCGTSRAIGWFLEPLALIALWGKKPLTITLRGITNDSTDCGVDVWRTVTLPLLRTLTGAEDGFELKVVRRGAPPLGGGQVIVRLPVVKHLPPISLTDEGMVKRIRGVAYSARVSPQASNRMVDGARTILNELLADVYIFTDHMTGPASGLSPGFGITLVAETTSGRLLAAEAAAALEGGGAGAAAAAGDGGEAGVVPEDIGQRAAHLLLEEVQRGGVVDSSHQGLVLLLCALGPQEMSEVRLGPLTPHAVRTLRHIREFFGVQFSVRPERESQTIFLSCVGAGVKNLSKKVQMLGVGAAAAMQARQPAQRRAQGCPPPALLPPPAQGGRGLRPAGACLGRPGLLPGTARLRLVAEASYSAGSTGEGWRGDPPPSPPPPKQRPSAQELALQAASVQQDLARILTDAQREEQLRRERRLERARLRRPGQLKLGNPLSSISVDQRDMDAAIAHTFPVTGDAAPSAFPTGGGPRPPRSDSQDAPARDRRRLWPLPLPRRPISTVLVVSAALLNQKNEVLLSKRGRGNKNFRGLYEFPGGKIEPGEVPQFALQRELHEELGIEVDEGALQALTFVSHRYSIWYHNFLALLFVAEQWRYAPRSMEGQELVWVSCDDLMSYAD
ncbi:18S rRNA biogenesis RCL1, partial [Micractinium conductrix]